MAGKTDRTDIAGWVPFGIGQTKPRHYREMARVAWDNRDQPGYSWRILRDGVCDGCSLGPNGLRDDAVDGIHLCLTRLKMLRLNTMPEMDIRQLENVAALKALSGEALRSLGRLPYPMVRTRNETGFRRISWEEAFRIAAPYLRRDPRRVAFYTTSRGLTNEVYYVVQKFARLLGTSHIDNAARLCHAASTVALKQSLGVGASTCSYRDWIGTDLLILYGTDLANNQPVAVKYLYHARKRGARIVVVNPYREPGLERYWVPSILKSALFGTRLADDFFSIRIGGDVAFNNGVLKHLLDLDAVDQPFIRDHTQDFQALREHLSGITWEALEEGSGTTRDAMQRFAAIYAGCERAVFIWSMGLTQHRFGVQNVQSVINLALARGNIGKDNCGLVPIRGHSGVQGAAECGCSPGEFPGGTPVSDENAARFSVLWNCPVPGWKGMAAPEMLRAAERGDLDCFYIIGGNFVDTMPQPGRVTAALQRVPCRIHQDLVLNSAMLVNPGETALLFPTQTRYEQKGGGTITSTERRIRYSPEIPGRRIGETRSEWEVLRDLAPWVLDPATCRQVAFADGAAIREEMDRVIPIYRGIGALKKKGDQFQYGGPILLKDGVCPGMPDGRARFAVVEMPRLTLRPGSFCLATRRGKQFNSMLYGETDPLTGCPSRDTILISSVDAEALGISDGSPILLRSDVGEFQGRSRIADVHPGTLQGFWPELNVLVPDRLDPLSKEPDYYATVTVTRC